MKNNKIIYIVLACIILVAAVIIGFKGLNFGLEYSSHKELQVYIGKEFENNDIKKIVKDVIGNKEVIVQKVELYEEMVQITVKEISDEQIEAINAKINEKYGLENTAAEDVLQMDSANLRGRDLVKPFIFPIALSLIIILVYAGIRFRKINIFEILGKIFGMNILAMCLYVSILAITRIQINLLTVPAAIAIYAVVTYVIFNVFETKQRKYIQEENKKSK